VWRREEKYLAVIAVNKNRVIFLLKNDFHDGVHDVFRNVDFLRPLHVNDNVTSAIFLQEGLEFRRKFLLYKRAV
jgi:hypothetical protein